MYLFQLLVNINVTEGGGWAFWLNCEFMACFILSNSYLLQISTLTHPYLSWQNKKATILWSLYRKTNCHYRDSLPLHLEAGSYRMALMSPSCPATLKKSGFNAFIFCLMCHRVRVLDLLFPNSPVPSVKKVVFRSRSTMRSGVDLIIDATRVR